MSDIKFELVDIPIEFKEINPSDFDSKYYNVEEKLIIEPDKKGFISGELLPILERGYDVKNTVVINAGVGQGKSKAILKMARQYAESDEYIVVIAVPSKNLIKQYEKDCRGFIGKEKIFNLLEIDNVKLQNIFQVTDDDLIEGNLLVSKFKIHILTINGLLGNAGDNNLFQAGNKRSYFEELQEYCTTKNKKLVIIFDEIHDSIHNFKQELIINLWNYQGLVHKIFTVSATYNEASKEVIKYLSELTNRNIQIIESKRVIIKEKQSDLYINFFVDRKTERDKSLIALLSNLIEKEEKFDIVVYSSKLTKKLISKPSESQKCFEVNNLLHDLKINRCYNDMFDIKSKQTYSPSHINIGTNFTTGVNIEKHKHNYIIIFPKDISFKYFNNKGVFTNGANTIIQTLARQRKPGKIHIFLPEPVRLKEESLKYEKEISDKILSNFEKLNTTPEIKVNYSNINEQGKVLDQVYSNLLYKAKNALQQLSKTDRAGMNTLQYPSKEIFKLYKGEQYLADDFFGGNISSYIMWAAMCNQFLNCKLSHIQTSHSINLSSQELENEINSIYKKEKDFLNSFYEEFSFFSSLTAFEKFEYFTKYFFDDAETTIDNNLLTETSKDKIIFILIKLIIGNNIEADKGEVYLDYLNSSIYYAHNINLDVENHISIKENDLTRIKLFKKWNDFIVLLQKHERVRKKDVVLPATMFPEFEKLFIDMNMKEELDDLARLDFVLSNKNFPFSERFRKCTTIKQYAKSFYKLLIEATYNVKKAKPVKEQNQI